MKVLSIIAGMLFIAILVVGGVLYVYLTKPVPPGAVVDGNPVATNSDDQGSNDTAEPVPDVPCSDDGISGAAQAAADAWHQCLFPTAVAKYKERDDSFTPAVRACAAERTQAYEAADQKKLGTIEKLVDGGPDAYKNCRAAKAVLRNVKGFNASSKCTAFLEECEKDQWKRLQGEIKASTKGLKRRLKDEVRGVEFRQVGESWRWDILINGPWRRYFSSLEEVSRSKDTSLIANYLNYFINIVDAVGRESKKTHWTSRRLYFRDRDACVGYLTTKNARRAATQLKKARRTKDVKAWDKALKTVFKLKDCPK